MLKSLKEKINIYTKEEKINQKPINVQLAYSGGMDSSCLLDALIKLKSINDINLFLTYINYSTSKYSNEVCSYIDSIKIDNAKKNILNVKIDDRLNFESEARKVRYNFLKKIHHNNNIDLTFTAHHLNDQIETIIMKFLDGSDYISMQGIRKKYEFIFRPLLELDKQDIVQYALKNNVKFFKDPSNEDISFKRNKVRKFIAPYIQTDKFLSNKFKLINKNSILKFSKLKNMIDEDLKKINFNKSFGYLFVRINDFKKYNLVGSKNFITSILKINFNKKLESKSKGFWLSVYDFILNSKTGSVFNFTKNIVIQKNRDVFFVYDCKKISDIFSEKTKIYNDLKWGIGKFLITSNFESNNRRKTQILIDNKHFSNGIYVRRWSHGDKISNTSKKISDMFVKMKIPLFLKQKYPIIEDSKGCIIWIPGIYLNKKYCTNNKEGKKILWME